MLASFGFSSIGPLSVVATGGNIGTDFSLFGWCGASALVAAVSAIVVSAVRSSGLGEAKRTVREERLEFAITTRRPIPA